MKLLSLLLCSDQCNQVKSIEKKMDYMNEQMELFKSRFSGLGWCVFDSIDFTLIEKANAAFEKDSVDSIIVSEQILLDYYKNDVKKTIHWFKNKPKELSLRYDLIQKAFNDHFEERYYASVPLFLIIIDGAVNDFTKSKGFFAEGTDVTAWDCLVGCSDSLSSMKAIFNAGRNKTNTEKITMPYRNGILHGRDLNYANEYVSCKCISLLFAIADWISMKESEPKRKATFEENSKIP